MNTCRVLFLVAGSITSVALAQPTFDEHLLDANGSGDAKALADIDGDGKADPILGGLSLQWYEAGANFAKRTIRSSPINGEFSTDAQARDLDGDGDNDIIIGDEGTPDNVLWFENPRIRAAGGNGSDPRVGLNWAVHVIGSHGDYVHDLEIADLDADGKLDVVTSGHGRTHVFRQVSPTQWTDRLIGDYSGISLGDIDRDGRPDIATAYGWVKTPANLATGTWTMYPINNVTGDEVVLGDLNGDGRLDIMMCDAHGRAVVAWFQQPATATSAAWTRRTIDTAMGSHHPECVDFNNDGRMDLLLGLELQELSIYTNMGGNPPTFQKMMLSQDAAHNARAGDMDGDGRLDVFGCDYILNPPAKRFMQESVGTGCVSDFDNGTGTGTPDGATDINDLLYFLTRFELGTGPIDIDDGTATGTPDGNIDINDLLYFLERFEAGC